MEQLELFPNDIVRFATELSDAELVALGDRDPNVYRRIRAIRTAVYQHKDHVKHLGKKLDTEIDNIIYGGRYV